MGAEASTPGARGVDVSLATTGGKRWWTGVGLGGNWDWATWGGPPFANSTQIIIHSVLIVLLIN